MRFSLVNMDIIRTTILKNTYLNCLIIMMGFRF